MKRKRKRKGKKSIIDQVRKPTPKKGFAFKDRKRDLEDREAKQSMRDYE